MPDEEPIRISTEKARQGRTGTGLRYVLVGGIVLGVIALTIISFIHH